MDAAIREYAEHGRAGFSLNGVARRAGVGKSTIYLRWADKDALLGDAIAARSSSLEQVDTGSLRADLRTLATNLLRYWLDPAGWVTLRVAVDVVGADTAPAFATSVAQAHREAAQGIVTRAVERGELRADVPGALMVEAVYGTLLMKALSGAAALRDLTDDELATVTEPVVELVLSGVADHVLTG